MAGASARCTRPDRALRRRTPAAPPARAPFNIGVASMPNEAAWRIRRRAFLWTARRRTRRFGSGGGDTKTWANGRIAMPQTNGGTRRFGSGGGDQSARSAISDRDAGKNACSARLGARRRPRLVHQTLTRRIGRRGQFMSETNRAARARHRWERRRSCRRPAAGRRGARIRPAEQEPSSFADARPSAQPPDRAQTLRDHGPHHHRRKRHARRDPACCAVETPRMATDAGTGLHARFCGRVVRRRIVIAPARKTAAPARRQESLRRRTASTARRSGDQADGSDPPGAEPCSGDEGLHAAPSRRPSSSSCAARQTWRRFARSADAAGNRAGRRRGPSST